MRRDVLTLHRGSTWETTWPLTDENGADWIWQGTDDVRAQLRAEHAGGTVLHTWTDAASGVDKSVDGELTLSLAYTDSEAWTARRAVCDIEVTRDGERARPISFVLVIVPDVTT